MKQKGLRIFFFILAILLGAGAGMAFGWLFMPASAPKNADLPQLRADYKTDLALMVAETYAREKDLYAALDRLARIEPDDPYSLLVNAVNYAQGVGYQESDVNLIKALIDAIDPAAYRDWSERQGNHGQQ
ncbi:MAG: hypothetical protein GX415_05210 [Chloroflexi bacterium]|jgi:hypothetical protein|nr:hypothetical protein [Anaerolineaceae bacterium]NLI44792.1 hypothetical protein [Chloroflexota bacterium]NMD26907.1 hypothetical protein [Chloroflexota bacterium]HOE34947.1 hypothetical protein [Anaerolineaceae bacterium]HQL27218.1 hypothetical protein [Anaerolineaceae bacterium]